MKKVTIKRIAELANVSVASVSFVINNKPGVSEETRARIQRIIDETNFVPNIHSKRLMQNKSYNIVLLVQGSASPFQDLFYYEIIQGLFQTVQAAGYNLVFSELKKDSNNTYILPNVIRNQDCDGIIIFQDIDPSLLEMVKASNLPLVLVDNHNILEETLSVRVDIQQLCYRATEYLIAHGHKKIGFLGSSSLPAFYTKSFRGFSEALSSHDIPLTSGWILSDANNEQAAYESTDKLISSGKLPTAIVCSGDRLAIGGIRAAKANGMHIPADLSFIGIDDIVLSRYIDPPLTTIKIEKVLLGQEAGKLLLKEVENKPIHKRVKTLVMTEIIERKSVKPL